MALFPFKPGGSGLEQIKPRSIGATTLAMFCAHTDLKSRMWDLLWRYYPHKIPGVRGRTKPTVRC